MRSNLRITPQGLISLVLLLTALAGVAGVVCVMVAVFTGFVYLAFGILAPLLVFLITFNAPKISQSSRASALQNEFPFMIGFIEVLAGGGVSPISALRRISRMEKVFPAAAKEAKRILIDIDVFGTDPITAFEKAARYSPYKPFANFLYGYTTVLKTGGDVTNYVDLKMKEAFDQRSSKIKRTTDSTATIAEAYLTVTSVLGISLFTLYEVQAVLSHVSGGLQNLLLFSFVGIPVLSVLFLWILDGIQPKQPHTDMRPYKLFFMSAPVGALLFLLPLPLKLPIQASLAMSAMVLGPAIVTFRQARTVHGMEKALPDFIRDVAEGRKIGLPPEGSIEALAAKDYGALSGAITRMASQISWGLSIGKVVSTFAEQVSSWITRVVGTLMVEVVDVGGGTVKSFSEMAEFTRKVNEIEADKRSALRPFIFVTYMSALLFVFTTFLMVYYLAQPALLLKGTPYVSGALPTVDPSTVGLLLVAAIFDSWIAGIVAGKMGNGAISEGFKHALLLVIISVAAVYITGLFVPIQF